MQKKKYSRALCICYRYVKDDADPVQKKKNLFVSVNLKKNKNLVSWMWIDFSKLFCMTNKHKKFVFTKLGLISYCRVRFTRFTRVLPYSTTH